MSRVKSRYLIVKALLISYAFGMGGAQAAERGELDAWIAANRLGTPDAYESFLEAFPDGEFAEIAFELAADAAADAFEDFDTAAGGPSTDDTGAPDDEGAPGKEGGQY